MDSEIKVQMYLMGYEDGQKEAWSEIKRLIKKHDGWELKSRIQSKLGTLYQDIDFKRAELMDDPTLLYIEEESIEEPREEPKTDWNMGESYLILEKKPFMAVDAMLSLLGGKNRSLFITSELPDKMREKYGITDENIQFLELSTSGYSRFGKTDLKCTPSNLSSLSGKIGDSIKDKSNPIILMHGMQDIVNRHQFPKSLEFVKWMIDKLRRSNGTLILSVDSTIFDEKDLARLETYFDQVLKG